MSLLFKEFYPDFTPGAAHNLDADFHMAPWHGEDEKVRQPFDIRPYKAGSAVRYVVNLTRLRAFAANNDIATNETRLSFSFALVLHRLIVSQSRFGNPGSMKPWE